MGPLPKEQPVRLRFQFQGTDAFIRQTVTHEAWVVKHSDSDLTVFSPICTHLGCHYDWVAIGQRVRLPLSRQLFLDYGQGPRGSRHRASRYTPLSNRKRASST